MKLNLLKLNIPLNFNFILIEKFNKFLIINSNLHYFLKKKII